VISSVFGSSEECPAEFQLNHLDTFEEIMGLAGITPYCWRDQVGHGLHQCNIFADKLVQLLNEGTVEDEEYQDWQDKCNVQRRKEIINPFFELNAETNAIMSRVSQFHS
jgi:hypothetical protein